MASNSSSTFATMLLCSNNRSLVALSMLWVALCTGLVHKSPKLIAVFFAFCTSFVLAAALSRWFKTCKTPNNKHHQLANQHIKSLVGLIACSSAFWFLSCHSSSSIDAFSSSSNPSTAEYKALSIAAGYLAFDHWWSALYCQSTKPLSAVTEDAATLTAILMLLTRNANQLLLPHYRTAIAAWIAYKIVRLSLQLLDGRVVVNEAQHQQDDAVSLKSTSSSLKATTSLSDKIMSKHADHAPVVHTWTIHGVQYDLSDYVERHPGGKEAILLGRGRDCTALFESYHPFTENHAAVLQKYRVVARTTSKQQQETTTATTTDHFYEILCQRVAKCLADKGVDPIQDRAATWTRTGYYLLIAAALTWSGVAHCRGSILGSFLLAIFGWLIGALGHDAGHFAASRIPVANDVGVWAMSVISNPILWQHQHTYAHHSHTNQFDHDPDLHHFHTLLRVHRRFQQHDIYKHQSNVIFVLFAYTVVVFGTCVWIPWGVIQEGTLYGLVEWTDRGRPVRAAGMFLHMAAYIGIIMVLPFWVHSSWLSALVAVTIHVATSGLIFAIFSQINHLNEPSLDDGVINARQQARDPRLKDSWAVAQVETSNNFCANSLLWHVLSNGLNLQIEHHLFPGLNHCHLPLITSVVQATCKEYGVCYKNYKSYSELMRATLDWLDRLSGEP